MPLMLIEQHFRHRTRPLVLGVVGLLCVAFIAFSALALLPPSPAIATDSTVAVSSSVATDPAVTVFRKHRLCIVDPRNLQETLVVLTRSGNHHLCDPLH